MKIHPESSILTSVFIPDFFEPRTLTTEDDTLRFSDHFEFIPDATGRNSIIRFSMIPYIDISYYDFERKSWYAVDQYGGKWRIFRQLQYKPHTGSIHTESYPVFVSMDGMYGGSEKTAQEVVSEGFTFTAYQPIVLKLNSKRCIDITDYSGGRNVVPKLNEVPGNLKRQFYYDGKFSIYTNQELSNYDIDDVEISITTNIDKVNVKCRMGTNTTGLTNYTPYVDFYILKLTGQNL